MPLLASLASDKAEIWAFTLNSTPTMTVWHARAAALLVRFRTSHEWVMSSPRLTSIKSH